MARLCLLGSLDQSLPEAWELLPHTLVRCASMTEGHLDDCQAVVVDCRTRASQARQDCLAVAAEQLELPILLLASTETLPLISPEWGADDFIVEGAGAAEVETRLRFLLHDQGKTPLEVGPFRVDEQAYTASAAGRDLDLTYTEFELFKYLVAHPGRVLTRDVLLSQVWGYDYYGGTRTVDVHIRRLRAKVGPEFEGHIQTVRSVGYRLRAGR